MNNELEKKENSEVAAYNPNVIYGFEETKSEDIIIPRIKVINALSPERTEGIAQEGDIINSLTKESVIGKRFIPIKQYYSNMHWNSDRNAENRILCRSLDGRIGNTEDGAISCAQCKKNQFDNTKKGKDSYPTCTAYINFLGFFDDEPMPVVLSFAKTNYNEGRKMLSIARSLRVSLWKYAYSLVSKKVSKDRNIWYIVVPNLAGSTTPEQQALAFELYKIYNDTTIDTNYEDTTQNTSAGAFDAQTENEIG